MRSAVMTFLGFLCAVLPAAKLIAQETIELTPRFQAGQRWTGTLENAIRIQVTDGPAGPINTPGLLQSTVKYSATVIEAQAGRWTRLDLAFDNCEWKSQPAGAERPQTAKDPVSNKRLTLIRSLDRESGKEKIDIDTHGGAALPVTSEDNLRLMFGECLMTHGPIRIGHTWKTEQVAALFGCDTAGVIELRLARIEVAPDGRRRAVVDAAGNAHNEQAGKTDPQQLTQTIDISVDYSFRGAFKVDLATGLIDAIDLRGDSEIVHGAAVGQGLHQRGGYQFTARATALDPVSIVANPPAPSPVDASAPNGPAAAVNPLAPAPSFAGTYKNERMSVQIAATAQGFSGTITLGQSRFPLTAKLSGQTLEGTFESGGNAFRFTAVLDGDMLQLASGGATHALKREGQQAVNPLGAAEMQNPLAP